MDKKHKLSKSTREVTPLTREDCLLVFDRAKPHFDFPVHFHPEYEINFVCDAKKAQRIVGDHVEYIDDLDLILTGPNLQHGWLDGKMTTREIHETTIQFHRDLFHPSLLERNMMIPIRDLFSRSSQGVKFSKPTIKSIKPRIEKLVTTNGGQSLVEFLDILFVLANSENQEKLSSEIFVANNDKKNKELKGIYSYIESNFNGSVKLEEIAKKHNMTVITFGRFMKRHTGKSFLEYLNDFRIGFATRQLIESNLTITEIAYNSGFNNLANFNRIFKKVTGCTPTEYKNNFTGIKRIL